MQSSDSGFRSTPKKSGRFLRKVSPETENTGKSPSSVSASSTSFAKISACLIDVKPTSAGSHHLLGCKDKASCIVFKDISMDCCNDLRWESNLDAAFFHKLNQRNESFKSMS